MVLTPFCSTFAHYMRLFLTITFLALASLSVHAQYIEREVKENSTDNDDTSFVPLVRMSKVLFDGDSIPCMEFNNVYIYPEPTFKNEKQRQQYNLLVKNVKAVLPIAKEVNVIIIETYEFLQTLPNEKARKAHLNRVEKSIIKEYTPRMRKLTYSQGKLLIKLVNRECNSSSYALIQAFLGPVRAGFYQAFAWAFGASLKKKYDPEGVDRVTERVVRQVESGQI